MKCLACKADAMKDTVSTYFAQLDHCYIIIENVPCKQCQQCGETGLTAVMHLSQIGFLIRRTKYNINL